MLFPYVYLPNHSIYKLQQWVDQIFLDVWCNANPSVEYNIDLLPDEIKKITLEIYNDDKIKEDYFYGPIERVYKIFQSMNQTEKNALVKNYKDNNAIEDLCKGTAGYTPFLYSDLDKLNATLKIELEKFFKSLFDSVINLKAVQQRIGTINEHYKEFVKKNSKGKCPVCGLLPIDGQYVHTRDAYDHYLPKSKYPFSSINFKNLAPICDKCNKGNKGANDPLHDKNGNRRKSFYAYNTISYKLEIKIQINTLDILKLTPQDISITFGPANLSDEIRTWNELFGIEERYKAKCCSEDAKYWLTQITDECQNYGLAPNVIFQGKLREAEKSPYSETNFLRKPFLEACDAQNVFR